MLIHKIGAAAMLGTMFFGAVANANTIELSPQEVPAILLSPPTPNDPGGSCSLCEVFPLLWNSSNPSAAFLYLHYEDDGQSVLADIEIEVVFDNQDYHTMLVENIHLQDGQPWSIVLLSGNSWDWDDADQVRITVHEVPS